MYTVARLAIISYSYIVELMEIYQTTEEFRG